MKKTVHKKKLPVDIVLAPEWWHKNTGITFDRDFFFHPQKRVESEQRMEKELYERWGKYGLGANKDIERPEVGAVHLAAGYMLSEMLGCEVKYTDNHPPAVVTANCESLKIDVEKAFRSKVYKDFANLTESLKAKYGYLTGDVNWGGVLNIAMDLRGDQIMLDLMMSPDEVKEYFNSIAGVISKFTDQVKSATGTTSVSVTRTVRHLPKPVFLHSECSHTMVSCEDYEQFLIKTVPYRYIGRNLTGLVEAIQKSLKIDRDRLYCLLSLPPSGITVEQAELPDLPATKMMVLQNATRALQSRPYQHWLEKTIETGTVIIDKKVLRITVEK